MSKQKVVKRMDSKQVGALVESALSQQHFAAVDPGKVVVDGIRVIELDVHDVKPYEGNPRTSTNHQELKDSIRSRGLDARFSVTKRPGQSFYITARGGCTRLRAMQELADEGDARFKRMEFFLVDYKSESDLLAGHLVENGKHKPMSFWDSAMGVVNLRSQLEQERGHSLSSREFEDALAESGLKTAQPILIDYRYLGETLAQLQEAYQQSVNRNDIRNILRPAQTLLAKLWEKHGKQGSDLDSLIRFSVSIYQDDKGYDPQRLADFIEAEVARELGYTAQSIVPVLAALRVSPDAPLADLLNPNPASVQAAGDASNLGDSQDGAAAPFAETPQSQRSDPDAQSPTLRYEQPAQSTYDTEPTLSRTGSGHGSDSSFGDSSVGSKNDDNYDDGDDGPIAGIPGLSVASGLTPNPPKAKPLVQPSSGQASLVQHQEGLALGFGTVPQASSIDDAILLILDEVQAAADAVGIARHVVIAPTMPQGYLMEVPDKPLGSSPEDYAVQGWWLLAILSGQLHPNPRYLLDLQTHDGKLVLPDTGRNGFRSRLEEAVLLFEAEDQQGMEQNAWVDAIKLFLGGQTQDEAWFLFEMATNVQHPLSEHTTTILNLIKQLNLMIRQEAV